ncbi:MAG: phosphatase PAP2 family protein [Paenirhodobacter sp.]|uniref:bifunctional DedA family/phosphatase PAP2 family protein n=1 Tax=Paenirhodobacter sp. TaxID=1965326 RepID=UPI003D11B242
MPSSIDQILPSLAALGMFAYWGIGLAAGLEAFVLTGLFLPGTLVVDAGGFMVQRGMLDFLDLVWFVAIGSILGGEASFHLGHRLRRGLAGRWQVEKMAAFGRAERLFARHGGFALVLGRFLGPVAAFVPLAAALSGMETRRFRLWNLASGVPYAIAHVSFGYLLGAGLTRLSPVLTREVLFALGLALGALVVWWVLRRLDRALPVLLALLGGLYDRAVQHPRAGSLGARHPRVAQFLAARLDRSHFRGLPATLLALAFGYLTVLWIGLALDFVQADPIVQVDARLAQLMQMFWSPGLLRGFTAVTALGDTLVVIAFLVIALMWLALARRWALMIGLLTALVTDLVSVSVLKLAFGRPRSALGYFAETTGSFPSGHAAIGIAFYGMLFYLLWRARRLGPVTAAFWAATTAFLLGLSRLYLIEHYLSDVLAGWLLGGICLVSGIAVAEWRQAVRPPAPRAVTGARAGVAALITLALLGAAGMRLNDYTKALNPRPAAPELIAIATPEQAVRAHALPAAAETLTGEHRFALNIAFLATTPESLGAALQAQGWRRAPAVTPGGLALTALADLGLHKAPDPALAPLFWNNRVNDLALSAPAEGRARDLPRLRLWQTRFVLPGGQRLWLGVMSRDDGLDPEHGADTPEEAAALAMAMGQAGALSIPGARALPLVPLD